MAARYFYTYSIQTGKHREHDEWVRQVGKPFWERQNGYRGQSSHYTLIGSGPDVVTEVEFESPDQITMALEPPEAQRTWEEFETLVKDLETKIIVPTGLV